MRPIEFRGRTDLGEWIKGNLIVEGEDYMIIPRYSPIATKVQADTVGQYIGKTDCLGNRIYEGDIIEVNKSYSFVVKFSEANNGFCLCNVNELDIADTWDIAHPIYHYWWEQFKDKIVVTGTIYPD